MKKVNVIVLLTAAICILGFSSCKKDSASSSNNNSSNLTAGRSAISFTNTGSFAGGTSFSQSNTATTTAQTLSSSSLRNVSLSATEISGINTRTVTMLIILPVDASTTSGNLVADLSLPSSATILPTITLSSTNGSTSGITYASKTGTFTITKLTSSEIEGTFSGTVEQAGGGATFSISNGSFAGKF